MNLVLPKRYRAVTCRRAVISIEPEGFGRPVTGCIFLVWFVGIGQRVLTIASLHQPTPCYKKERVVLHSFVIVRGVE
jgi:hypothetical protein